MSDELTRKLPPDDEVRSTQPSITAVFELIQHVKRAVDSNTARLNDIESQIQSVKQVVDSSAARLSDIESQVQSNATRLNEIEAQIKSGFSTLGYKIDALNRGRLQTEADYFNLLHRIEELESKAS